MDVIHSLIWVRTLQITGADNVAGGFGPELLPCSRPHGDRYSWNEMHTIRGSRGSRQPVDVDA